jgi:hypothetical protein
MDSQAGGVPVNCQVKFAPLPPLAASVVEYGVVSVPLGSEAVVMASVATSVMLAVAGAIPVALAVMVAVPGATPVTTTVAVVVLAGMFTGVGTVATPGVSELTVTDRAVGSFAANVMVRVLVPVAMMVPPPLSAMESDTVTVWLADV